MSLASLRCDGCDRQLAGLLAPDIEVRDAGSLAVRFAYDPGDVAFQDRSGLACPACWTDWSEWLGSDRPGRCSVCGTTCGRWQALHVRRVGVDQHWSLCARHAAEFLNRLTTVEPKLDPESFVLPFADRQGDA